MVKKQRKQKLKNINKGITLIALVITIIVMLILVAVTISIAVNGGLFEYARKATGEMKNAINAEQQLADGKIKIGDKWYASIDDYIKNNPLDQEETPPTEPEVTPPTEPEVTPTEIKIEITPTNVTLKKLEDGAEGTEKLTEVLTATVSGMESEPTITWEKSSNAIDLSSETGKSITVTAVGTENTEVTVTAKFTHEGKEYTATSKITLEIIEKEEPTAITAKTMQSYLRQYLGKPINYGVKYTGDAREYEGWEIFYADYAHIYIITEDCAKWGSLSLTDKDGFSYNGTADFTTENLKNKYPAVAQGLLKKIYDPIKTPALQFSSSWNSMKATQYLLDSRNWTAYANTFADWAIGAPTLELFTDSFSKFYSGTPEVLTPTEMGFQYDLGPYGISGHSSMHCPGWDTYWLAAPDNSKDFLHTVRGDKDDLGAASYAATNINFRPVVCLDSNVKIIWNSTTSQYDLDWVTEN